MQGILRIVLSVLTAWWLFPSRPAPAAPIRILPLGDSITRGYGSTDSGGYRKYLHARLTSVGLDLDFVGSLANGSFPDPQHEGHDGAYIRVLHSNWALQAQQTYDPQITLLMIGTNDCWTGTGLNSPENAPQNLNNLISGIFQVNPDTQLYVATIPRIWDGGAGQEYPSVIKYNATIPGIVNGWANSGKFARLVDVYPHVTVPQLFDGVHPNESGYATIGGLFFDALWRPGPLDGIGPRAIGNPATLLPDPIGGLLWFGAAPVLIFSRRPGRIPVVTSRVIR